MSLTKEQILNSLADSAVDVLKSSVLSVLVTLTEDELRPIVKSKVSELIVPLEEGIKTSDSLWVKIRNTLYIKLLENQVDMIVDAVIDGIKKLAEENK